MKLTATINRHTSFSCSPSFCLEKYSLKRCHPIRKVSNAWFFIEVYDHIQCTVFIWIRFSFARASRETYIFGKPNALITSLELISLRIYPGEFLEIVDWHPDNKIRQNIGIMHLMRKFIIFCIWYYYRPFRQENACYFNFWSALCNFLAELIHDHAIAMTIWKYIGIEIYCLIWRKYQGHERFCV